MSSAIIFLFFHAATVEIENVFEQACVSYKLFLHLKLGDASRTVKKKKTKLFTN